MPSALLSDGAAGIQAINIAASMPNAALQVTSVDVPTCCGKKTDSIGVSTALSDDRPLPAYHTFERFKKRQGGLKLGLSPDRAFANKED